MLVQISMLSMEGVYFVGPGLAPNKKKCIKVNEKQKQFSH